jgi:serine/threonine protein kinase
MSDPEDLVGRQVGPYAVDCLRADGGFTWVFAAHPTSGGDPVALKILQPRYAGDAQLDAWFHREADVAARLHHPNVVRILDAGRAGGHSYIAMPLYSHSLASLIAERGRIDEATVVRIGRDVAAGLACTHAADLVHCDVKPANILLADDGTAVLADFGIARAVSRSATASGADVTIGTPQYLSPEQAQGLPLDGRSDLYSLGVALYRAATGDVPFRSTDWFELARLHVEKPAPGVRTKAPELTPRFARVVARCLAKRPEARFGSATDLMRELERLPRR